MKRFVVSTLTALCGLAVVSTAHASFVEKQFQTTPETWKTQEEVNDESEVRLDARTAVPANETTRDEEQQQRQEESTPSSETIMKSFEDLNLDGATNVTRAQFTAMFVRSMYSAEEIDHCYWDITSVFPPRFELLFRDVSIDNAYAPEICIAMREGLVRGYGNDIFKPDAPITLGDAAKILARANGLTPWADPSQPKHWFDIYIQALSRRNAIPTSIKGIDDTITVDEAHEMIERLKNDDRSKQSLKADELILAWERAYDAPPRAIAVAVAPKPGTGTSTSVSSTGTKASSKATGTFTGKSSAPSMTGEQTSSRPKAWYEF